MRGFPVSGSMHRQYPTNLMKTFLCVAIALTTALASPAQEKLSREESLKIAFIIAADLKQMTGTPIPTDPDVKRPVVLKEGDYGAMLLPESKLSPEVFAKAGKNIQPVGQLWLRKLAPMKEGQATESSKLRKVQVSPPQGGSEEIVCCALGVQKSDSGKLELLVFGTSADPLLHTELKPSSSKSDLLIDCDAEHKEEGALLTLKFLGKYEASLMVTDPDR